MADEQTPPGLNTSLYKVIGPHGTSKICDAVLNAQLTEEDKENIEFVEAFELLRMTARPKENYTQNKSENWVKETVDRLLNTAEE